MKDYVKATIEDEIIEIEDIITGSPLNGEEIGTIDDEIDWKDRIVWP